MWTPSQPALDTYDSRVNRAVPMYELPPPDLMDFDMSYLVAVRVLPEWTKGKEDRHWEQVRRNRHAGLISSGGDRDECTVM